MDYLKRRPDEILTEVLIPPSAASTYWKLRRRGAFDFPVLGVAAAASPGRAHRARRGGLATVPRPQGERFPVRSSPTKSSTKPQSLVASRAKPMDNADLDLYWRKDVAVELAR